MFTLQRLLRKYNVIGLRNYSTKVKSKISEADKKELAQIFPEKFLKKKLKTPTHLYIANTEAADIINKYIQQNQCDTALEFNPGIGFLTEKLLEHECFKQIILVESLEHFMPKLINLQEQHPHRLKIKQGDFIGLWKLAYQDKLDSGTRVDELLTDVPNRDYDDDINMTVFGAVGCYQFCKHLINSIVFQNSLFTRGRCEMFLVLPPPIYIHLTCSNQVGYLIYRSTSMLFQMLFEYRFITQIPREYFLPTQSDYNSVKGSRLRRVKSINPEYLYLVKIRPRRNFLDLIPVEDLPALWYFVKQNCVSRRNRIIPNLERWVPTCGPRLIINKQNHQPVEQLYPDEDLEALPKYSIPCTTMHCNDFYPNMNIYTQFGDLTASQMLTLFKQFRQWPEYNESSFLASLESSLLKMEASADDSVDHIAEDDDVGSEMVNLVEPIIEGDTTQSTTKIKRKKKDKIP